MSLPYLVIDFDSTFVTVESLDELAKIALAGQPGRSAIIQQLQELTKQGMEGNLGFARSLAQRMQLFQTDQQHIDHLVDFLRDHVTPSVARSREFLQEQAGRIYIISGGFREYIVPVVADYGIAADHVLANHFIFAADGVVTGYDTSCPLAHDDGKVKQLAIMQLERPVYMIGDGYTDYQVKAAGQAETFLAFTENIQRASVVELADVILPNFDQLVVLDRSSRSAT
jgi:D-3-phosphoglycerate dehydrogenase / 2-oxoglutarate reductase